MKITMYELLGIVKDGKAPKKIKYNNKIYTLSNCVIDYINEDGDYLTREFCEFDILNEKIEILEEEKKIPEKLDNEYFERAGSTYKDRLCKDKINEIIDTLEMLNDKIK